MLHHLTRSDGWRQRRLFKTHCWYDHCPKGARYVWVVRDPVDVSFSFYKFFEGWLFEPGHVQLDEFIQQFILGRGACLRCPPRVRLGDHRTCTARSRFGQKRRLSVPYVLHCYLHGTGQQRRGRRIALPRERCCRRSL